MYFPECQTYYISSREKVNLKFMLTDFEQEINQYLEKTNTKNIKN